ncbi:MAG: NAD-binding protein, partial [Paracoccaceae bacterium]
LHGERMLDRNWVPGGPLELQLKDLNTALDVAKEAGLRLPLTEQARTAFQELTHEMDMGRYDHSAYLRWLEVQNPDNRLGQGDDLNP